MKSHFLLYLLLTLPFGLLAQIFQDDFSDGNLTANPAWLGDAAIFVVNANQELQLNDVAGGSALLYAPVSIADSTVWELYTRLEFAPSTSNQLRIYLSADAANLSGNLNGYFLEIGETGNNDALKLYRQTGSTNTLLMTGTAAAVATEPVTVRLKVVRNAVGFWQIFTDYTGGTLLTLEGTATDNTHSTGSYFGVHCAYTSTRKDKFYFDDIKISPLFVDNQPPVLDTLFAISNTEIDVYFDENIDLATGENPNNYTISNGIGNPSSALRDANNWRLVHLTVTNPLVINQNYTLSVANIADVTGNMLSAAQQNFTFTELQTAAAGDVLINEIMADPVPSVGLPEVEFVELYNASTKTINLADLIFYNSNTAFPLPSFTLQPQAYVVLCDANDEAEMASLGVSVIGLASFTALTNGGDDLALKNAQNEEIHTVNYTSNWYGDPAKKDGGYTLELKNPTLICTGGDNWQASNAANGGTPGLQNSIFSNTPDAVAPALSATFALDAMTLRLDFDENITSSSAQNLSNFTVNNGIGNPAMVQLISERSVEMTFTNSFQTGVLYELTVNGVADCSGNAVANATEVFEYWETADAAPYDVLITEIYADPSPTLGLPEAEFIELYNRSDAPINLQDFTFSTQSSTAVLPFFILKPKQYVILYEKNILVNYAIYGDALGLETLPSLGNSGAELVLANANGEILHTVNYELGWYQSSSKSDGGFSLEMVSTANFCQAAENWRASNALIGGTPGQANSVAQQILDVNPPKVLRAFPESATEVRLYFSEALSGTTGEAVANYAFVEGGLQIGSATLESPNFTSVLLTLDAPLQAGIIYTIEIKTTLADCQNNSGQTENRVQVALPETEIAAGDVLINEILFEPFTGGSDYLEVYNFSDKVLNLKDLTIANTENGWVKDFENVAEDRLFFPKTYLVLTEDVLQVQGQYLQAGGNAAALVRNNLPTFPSDVGGVLLLHHGVAVDGLAYNSDWHHTLLADKKGVSLERISLEGSTQDANNWHSAAATVGFGTPTYQNSQFSDMANVAQNTFSVAKKTFSPDGDGFEDFLKIDYALETTGFVANIDIYDAEGRLVKRLARNELLGLQGFLKWDGTTDAGAKARMGIYVVWIGLTHPSGKVERIKRTVVLAGRI